MTGASEEANPLQRVPSTPTSTSKWLNPPLSPSRSISLSPSRMRKSPLSSSMGRHTSVSPRRFNRESSASPAPRNRADRRQKLKEYSSLDDAVNLLKESMDIVVLSGAGISTSIGIPDFRSKQGLYNLVQDKRFSDPQQLFYRDMFEQYPKEFWRDVRPIVPKLRQGAMLNEDGSNAKSLISAVPKYSIFHSFLEVLQTKEKLLTNFTQNIDALELDAGVEPDNLVACHGTWETATCLSCSGKVGSRDYLPIVLAGKLPLCSCGKPSPIDPDARQSSRLKKAPKVEETDIEYVDTIGGDAPGASRPSRHKRRRIESELASILARDSDDDDKYDAPSRPGLLKPDITFFGEPVAESYYPTLNAIRDEVDLLIIVGTSLAAEPVSQLPLSLPPDVPQIWISNERCTNKVKGLQVDIELIGDADTIVQELCARAGWGNHLENRKWRNQLGSNRQAKAAITKAKQEKAQLAMTQTQAVSADHNAKDSGRVTEKHREQEGNEKAAPVAEQQMAETPNEAEKAAQVVLHQNAEDQAKAENATEFMERKSIDHKDVGTETPAATPAPSTTDTSPQSIRDIQPPSLSTAAPTVKIEEPPLSPPIPIRSDGKRPLSMAETLGANAAAFDGSRTGDGPSLKKLRAQSPGPAKPKVVKPTPATSSSGKAIAGAGAIVFQDAAFDWVTYFKKPKV